MPRNGRRRLTENKPQGNDVYGRGQLSRSDMFSGFIGVRSSLLWTILEPRFEIQLFRDPLTYVWRGCALAPFPMHSHRCQNHAGLSWGCSPESGILITMSILVIHSELYGGQREGLETGSNLGHSQTPLQGYKYDRHWLFEKNSFPSSIYLQNLRATHTTLLPVFYINKCLSKKETCYWTEIHIY